MTDQEEINSIKRGFSEFLDYEFEWGTYSGKLKQLQSNRLIISIDDVRDYQEDLARRVLKRPLDYIPHWEDSVREMGVASKEFCIGIDGNFGANHLTPRRLLSHHLGSLVCVEGIVTKCSLIRPKVEKTVHYCEATNKFLEKEYRDQLSTNGLPTGYVYPTKDEKNNPIQTEFGLSTYKDTQTLSIQEMPERAPAGQLPRSIDVYLENDLVDRVKPGDRLRVVGIYRAIASRSNNTSSGVMRTILVGNNIILLGAQVQSPNLSGTDITNIKNMAKQEKLFDMLSASIAPSIYGHEFVKKALLLLLFGGVEKNFQNGTHIRGDINVLMVGDPSTAKSQLLRFMLHLAPLAISTTGRASTGVGLTAAVTSDKDSGERVLQAGAMVLADRGIVCVDEFDKMSDVDRVAMHEVMEQQTVTIAKAGVHTSLNARCSVIAAANPIYGQYDRNSSIQRNVGLPDSLLSRFDMLFIILDEKDSKLDRIIADHVLNVHMYRKPGEEEGTPVSINDTDDLGGHLDEEEELEDGGTKVFEKNDFYSSGRRSKHQLVSIAFLRKYIYYAKNRIKPVLSEEAINEITEAYCKLRKDNTQTALPITPRTLETLIRLATAHARMRLSDTVTKQDVDVVKELMEFSISFLNNRTTQSLVTATTNKAASKPQKKKTTNTTTRGDANNSSSSNNKKKRKRGAEEEEEDNSQSESQQSRQRMEEDVDAASDDDEEEEEEETVRSRTALPSPHEQTNDGDEAMIEAAIAVSEERAQQVNRLVRSLRQQYGEEGVTIDIVVEEVNKATDDEEPFSRKEVESVLRALMEDNVLLLDENGLVYFI